MLMIGTLVKMEIQKYFMNRKLLVVCLILFGFFLYLCATKNATINAPGGIIADVANETVENKELINWKAMEMDTKVKEEMISAYQTYVDEHLLSKEQLEENAKKYGMSYEELYEQRYDFMNSYVVMEEQADAVEVQVIKEKYFYTLLKEHIVETCLTHSQRGDIGEQTLSDAEMVQLRAMAEENLASKPLIKGYHVGFEYVTSNMQFLPFLLGILLVVACYGVFSFEKAKKTDALILTCKLGKRESILAKLIAVLAFASVAWVIFQVANLLICAFMFTLEGGTVSVFDERFISPYGFTYLEYYAHQLFFSYFGTVLLALVICFLSQLTRPLPTITLGLIFVFFTSLLQRPAGNEAFTMLSKTILLMPTQMMSAFTTYRQYLAYMIDDHPIVLPTMQAIVLVCAIPLFAIVTYQLTRHRQIKH